MEQEVSKLWAISLIINLKIYFIPNIFQMQTNVCTSLFAINSHQKNKT